MHPAVLLGFAVLGCGDNPETVRLDVYSWWDQAEEKVGFETVARMHMDRHENVEVRNLDADGSKGAQGSRDEMRMRMLSGAPPATFLANIGADVLRWALVDTERDPNASVEDRPDSSRNLIRRLDDLFRDSGLTVPQELAAQLQVGDGTGPFAVPLNIHRTNVLYYNVARRAAFERTGKNLLRLETLCPDDPDDPSTPELGASFAAPFREPWPFVLLVFENILPALVAADPAEDPDYYTKLLKGERSGSVDKIDRAFACAQYLARAAHPDSSSWDWADAVHALANPDHDATFAVIGDWASPLVEQALADGVVAAVPFPGTERIYVYTSDTFPLPKGVDHPAETIELLKTFASADGQREFSRKKGSIPARLGVNFESPTGWSSEDFTDPTMQKLLATSGYFPPYFPTPRLEADLAEMMRSGVDPGTRAKTLRAFTDLEPLLTRWQTRLAQGLVPPPAP